MLEAMEYDVLIIGGGAAGLRAVIAAGESAPKLSVALVSKVYPVRSHTVAAEGGVAGVSHYRPLPTIPLVILHERDHSDSESLFAFRADLSLRSYGSSHPAQVSEAVNRLSP